MGGGFNIKPDAGNLDVALALTKAGLPILPVEVWFDEAKGKWIKKPHIINWRENASTDEAVLREWWRKWPDACPGIELGRAGLVVVDCDRHGGADGVAGFAQLVAEHVPLVAHPICNTAGDGQHHYFRQWKGETFGNSEGELAHRGINVRGSGGLAIAPGAIRSDGKRWSPAGLATAYHDNKIPLLPDWIAAMIRRRGSSDHENPPPAAKSPNEPLLLRTPWSAEDEGRVQAALQFIPSDDRNATWLPVGMALHSTNWPSARAIWDEWSKTTPGAFDADDQDKTWQSFDRPYNGKPVMLGSIFHLARECRQKEMAKAQPVAPPEQPLRNGAASPQPLPLRLPIIKSSKEFVAGFVPPEYVVVGLFQRRFIYSNTGQTGAGKTAVTLRLAASTALGTLFAGHETKKVRVLYAAAENPDDVRMRWIALAQHMAFDINTIEVYFTEGTFKISQTTAKLRAEAERHGGNFGLVIIDTGPAFFEGDDENSRAQMGTHARLLRSLINIIPGGPCVVANVHPTKNAGADNLLPAGGGTFLNEMDGNTTCARNDSITEMHWQGKFRGPDFAPMHFLIKTVTNQDLKDSDGRLIPTVICEHLGDQAQQDIEAGALQDENAVLKFISENAKASQSSVAITMGWKLYSGEPNKSKAGRCIKRLIEAKLIKEARTGRYTLTDEGKKVLKGEGQ